MDNVVMVGVVPLDYQSRVVDPKEYESTVDADIAAFDAHFQGLGNDPLVGSEKAIIKTWIWWHLHVVGKSTPSP